MGKGCVEHGADTVWFGQDGCEFIRNADVLLSQKKLLSALPKHGGQCREADQGRPCPSEGDLHENAEKGNVAERYGVLRSDGMTERTLFLVDKEGIVRHIEVYDINERPLFVVLAVALAKLKK